MKAATLLGDGSLSVEPGSAARCEVRLRNGASVVDQFAIDVVGDTADWAEVESATVNLLPGGEATVGVEFSPPRSADVAAGTYAFGIRVRSRENPDASGVEEGSVEVAPFVELDAELLPTKRRGRKRARYRLAVENAGNTPMRVEVETHDPEDDQIDIRLNRTYFTVQPATVVLLALRVQPFRRFMRGEPQPHPFELRVLGEAVGLPEVVGDPLVVKGQMLQERLLPGWVLPALAALTAVAVALTALWFMVVAPGVKTIASEQVQGQVDEASLAAAAASEAAAKADDSAKDAAAGLSSAAAATTATPPPTPAPLSFRVATFADPVTDGSFQRFTFTAPGGRAMDIGDIMLQNPRGDIGFLRIAVGETVLLETGLANFTDLTYSYSTKLRVAPGRQLVVAVNCVTPGEGAARCSPAASFTGLLQP